MKAVMIKDMEHGGNMTQARRSHCRLIAAARRGGRRCSCCCFPWHHGHLSYLHQLCMLQPLPCFSDFLTFALLRDSAFSSSTMMARTRMSLIASALPAFSPRWRAS